MATAFGGVTTNFKIGGMRVTYNSVDLGYTVDGSVFRYTTDWVEARGDQDGTSILEGYLSGENGTVELRLMEVTPTNLNTIMVAGTLSAGPTSKEASGGGSLAGSVALLANANTLKLHPLDTDDSTTTKDWTFTKAVPLADSIEIKMTSQELMSINVTFRLLPDTSKTRGSRLFQYGVNAT